MTETARRLLVSLLTATTMVTSMLGGSSSAEAARPTLQSPVGGPAAEQGAERRVASVVRLTPEKGTAAAMDVIVTTYSDKSFRVDGSGTADLFGPTMAYSFDLAKGTYTAVEEHSSQPLSNAGIAAAGGRVRVVVKDPVWAVLSQTMNELWWNINPDGTVSFANLIEWCSASNPSAAGTHWFAKHCDSAGTWQDMGNRRIMNYSEGIYENWDWLDVRAGTWSRTGSTIYGRQGPGYDFAWSYESWGESYRLLHGTVYVN